MRERRGGYQRALLDAERMLEEMAVYKDGLPEGYLEAGGVEWR